MQRYNILWADDEIDLLKPHILFLENKGNKITAVNNGAEAIEQCENNNFDVVFLDENMPGMSGLETLDRIKVIRPSLPVIMITKSEEEQIMEDAIGAKIADYLIKPLNPNQILLSMKRILENKRLVSEKTNINFQQGFRDLSMAVNENPDFREWAAIYKDFIFWDLEMESTQNKSMSEVLDAQRDEANSNFSKYIIENYEDWLNDPDIDKPLLSNQLMKKKVFPLLEEGVSVFFVVIDNLRYDQWKIIEPILQEYFDVEKEESYYSILPTTTAFSRNSIFSGMMPLEMA
ncbi:MAG: response regulator, partial [Cyclobacteriaceae bacterium]|nr:response regulator [Cyclobacteriaceae bacterium]